MNAETGYGSPFDHAALEPCYCGQAQDYEILLTQILNSYNARISSGYRHWREMNKLVKLARVTIEKYQKAQKEYSK